VTRVTFKSQLEAQVWWYTPVISALGRLRQEDCESKASLEYIVRPYLKKKKKKKSQLEQNICWIKALLTWKGRKLSSIGSK
jgi:hypothetical protein